MGRDYQHVGLGHTPSYQVSGIPFVTGTLPVEASSGTVLEISFYNVTRFLTVKNTVDPDIDAPMRVGFSELGVQGTNYFILESGESFTGEIKCSRVYLLGDTTAPASASIIAGLTGIGAAMLTNNYSGSAGVG